MYEVRASEENMALLGSFRAAPPSLARGGRAVSGEPLGRFMVLIPARRGVDNNPLSTLR
jgi:hypothetical protein